MTLSWPETVRGKWLAAASVFVLAVVAVGNLVRGLGDSNRTALGLIMSVAAAATAVAALTAVSVVALRASRREARARRLRLLDDAAYVSKVDPLRLGVARPSRPELAADYLLRSRDDELDKKVRAALAPGAEHWIVVVDGRPTVGKSRSLYQALCRFESDRKPLTLVAPEDAAALRGLFDPPQGLAKIDGPAVLWLGDIENFLNSGMTVGDLRRWRSGGARRMVAATFGSGAFVAGRHTLAYIRENFISITFEMTTEAELKQGVQLPQAEFDAAREIGWAAYLVAGDLLASKLGSGRHPGETAECDEGLAVVHAAIDWARCGRRDPIRSDTLEKLWREYLPPTIAPSAAGFKTALKWAIRPVSNEQRAQSGLLSYSPVDGTDGYRAHPYAVLLRSEEDKSGPVDQVWRLVLDSAPPLQAMAVGAMALKHGRGDDAIKGMTLAAAAPPGELPAILGAQAWLDVANLHMARGHREESLTAWRKVIDIVGDDPDPSRRLLLINAWISKAGLLGSSAGSDSQDSRQEALEDSQKVIDEYFHTDDAFIRKAVRAHAATALVNKGSILANQRQVQQATEVWDRLIDDCFDGSNGDKPDLDHPDPFLPVNLCKALFYKGNLLAGFDTTDPGGPRSLLDTKKALESYGRLLNTFVATSPPTTRQQVEIQEMWQKAVIHQALIAIRAGDRSADARTAVQIARKICAGRVAACDAVKPKVPEASRANLDRQIAEELLTKAELHSYLGELTDGGDCYRRIFSDYGDSPHPAMRSLVARALYGDGQRYAAIFKGLGHSGDMARDRFATLVDEFGDDSDPVLKRLVAQARAELTAFGS